MTDTKRELTTARRAVEISTQRLVEGRRMRRQMDVGITILSVVAAGEAFLMVNAPTTSSFYTLLVGILVVCTSLTYVLHLRGKTVDGLVLNAADWCEDRAQYDRLLAGQGYVRADR
jgi:hypothetical protein